MKKSSKLILQREPVIVTHRKRSTAVPLQTGGRDKKRTTQKTSRFTFHSRRNTCEEQYCTVHFVTRVHSTQWVDLKTNRHRKKKQLNLALKQSCCLHRSNNNIKSDLL